MIRLARVAGKGRGLLAERSIPAGSCLERAPAVRLSAADRAQFDRSAFFAYYFADPETFEAGGGHPALVAFGLLTFCNHAENPNAIVRWEEDDIGLWGRLEALRDIEAGEEVTLFYTNIGEYSENDLFF